MAIERYLRRLLHRKQSDTRELRVLHSVLADAKRMAELARDRGVDRQPPDLMRAFRLCGCCIVSAAPSPFGSSLRSRVLR